MKRFEKIIGIMMLIGTLVFNLWLYREEPTSTVDPNDNAFQFGLVERTNQMWDYANATCSGKSEIRNQKSETSTQSPVSNFKFRASDFVEPPLPVYLRIPGVCQLSFLTDHWVPNWAQGYNLPYYYSHVPQIMIVGSYRWIIKPVASVFSSPSSVISLFTYYHTIIYLLLVFIPLPVFLGLRILGCSWLTAGIGALLASHISTDGLYGLDQSSYLWRGWGLSSQLFAAVPLPLAIALSIKFLSQQGGRSWVLDLSNVKRKNIRAILFDLRSKIYDRQTYFLSILFLVITISGHLGIGMMTLITVGVAGLAPAIVGFFRRDSRREITTLVTNGLIGVAALAIPTLVILSYWIIPTLLGNNYHNISFWDPVWKFDSYGVKEVLVNLGNGALFDFERMPLYTLLVLLGAFGTMMMRESFGDSTNREKTEDRKLKTEKTITPSSVLRPQSSILGLLFFIWLILYFGRTTWGGLIDLIPGMTEFHISRFIVMIHALGMLLAPIGLTVLVDACVSGIRSVLQRRKKTDSPDESPRSSFLYLAFTLIALSSIIPPIYQQTIKYASWNDVLIRQAIGNEKKVKANVDLLFAELKKLPPGRAFIGRGGGWGKKFRVAETPMYMYLSTYGVPTIAWLPETWSMNSDTEQYFSEDNASHYELYGLRYVIAPIDQKPQSFWNLYKENPFWKLYVVDTTLRPPSDGEGPSNTVSTPSSIISPPSSVYIGVGQSPTVVESGKNYFINLVHLWIQSEYPAKGVYPTLTYKHADIFDSRPAFSMTDEATYRLRDGTTHSLVKEIPQYTIKPTPMTVTSESSESDMAFSGTVTVSEECGNCIAFLRQTYHPSWKAWVDGKEVKPFIVFPFYTAVWLQTPGKHTVVFRYEPSLTKVSLLTLGLGLLTSLTYLLIRKQK
jgi:hypothetical protein